MKQSPSKAPAITRVCFGRPTKFPNTHFGACSPANPAFVLKMVFQILEPKVLTLITPEPLSITTGWLAITASKLVELMLHRQLNDEFI
jgi:hypothetical protein